MMKIRLMYLFVVSALLGGCFLNPYHSDFTCPKTENGKCVSVKAAYDESLDTSKKKKSEKSLQDELDDIAGSKGKKGVADKKNVAAYQNALYEKLAGLLSEPTTPMVAPPQVMRVLLFPYRGDGNRLYMPRYIYMFVDDPRWVLDEKSAVQEAD